MSDRSDPRDPALEVPFSLPKSWTKDTEGLAAVSMFLSGAVMVTRNRFLSWPAILVAIAGYFGSRPMRQKDGGQGLAGIVFAFTATFSAYIPMLLLPPSLNQVPLPTGQ